MSRVKGARSRPTEEQPLRVTILNLGAKERDAALAEGNRLCESIKGLKQKAKSVEYEGSSRWSILY